MFRLLGILLGSAASLAAVLFLTGMPSFHLEDPTIDQHRFDEAVEKLMARNREWNRAAREKMKDVAEAGETTEKDVPPAAELSFSAPATDPLPLTDMQWYSFWNPFSTKIAASGFVSRLEEVTGLDYRVVKVKTGVYEVAFAYGDDDERRVKLSQISAATGLDLPDS